MEAKTGSDEIRFVLGGEVRRLRVADPTLTVLNYLRDVERRCGTKEGCAEGDCGACTVVLGELDGDGIRYRAINACILFVGALDGKQLVTVEDLGRAGGDLHPAQRALVDCHGSQCGFCTPGFVMSLFALYHAERNPSTQTINDSLAGNLCRCTGYRPIVDAARRMYDSTTTDKFDADLAATMECLSAIRRDDTLEAGRGGRRFFVPANANALAEMLLRHPDAHILAGGTDLGLLVTKQHQDLGTVIYVGNVRDLKAARTTGSHIEIDAAVTYTDAVGPIAAHYPDFAEVIRRLGSVPIRNAGTLAGNIANASPIGDTAPALIALGASVVLRRGDARREVSLDDFFIGYRKSRLTPGEFIERVRVPVHTPERQFRTYKVSKRFDQDISAVCGAYCLTLEAGRVRDIRICYGGMAATTKRANHCEHALIGGDWAAGAVASAMDVLDRDFAPISDMRAGAEYRMRVAKNLLWRFYLETSGERIATRVLEHGAAGDD